MNKLLAGQGVRFLIGGGANTLLSYVLYWVLLLWMPYAWAYTISYALAILSGFAISTLFVVWMAVEILKVPKAIAPLIATVVVLPMNFILTRKLIHRPD